MADKLRLGILFGSRSCEHEVSIISALQLAGYVNPFKYEVTLVYISRDGAWYVGGALWKLETYLDFNPRKSGLTQVFPDMTARSRALVSARRKGIFAGETRRAEVRLDCVIPVMHGLHGEDGSLQGMLEMMDMPYASWWWRKQRGPRQDHDEAGLPGLRFVRRTRPCPVRNGCMTGTP